MAVPSVSAGGPCHPPPRCFSVPRTLRRIEDGVARRAEERRRRRGCPLTCASHAPPMRLPCASQAPLMRLSCASHALALCRETLRRKLAEEQRLAEEQCQRRGCPPRHGPAPVAVAPVTGPRQSGHPSSGPEGAGAGGSRVGVRGPRCPGRWVCIGRAFTGPKRQGTSGFFTCYDPPGGARGPFTFTEAHGHDRGQGHIRTRHPGGDAAAGVAAAGRAGGAGPAGAGAAGRVPY